MIKSLLRPIAALAFAVALAPAHAAFIPPLAMADVTLTGWAAGSASKVNASVDADAGPLAYRGFAGGLAGVVSGSGIVDTPAFVGWCIEMEEQSSFGPTVSGYAVWDAALYFAMRHGDGSIAERLGRLMTYATDHPTLVSGAAGSTALQLAVWNLVYDDDADAGTGSGFADASSHHATATSLLAGAQGLAASRFEVYALERAGNQDLLALVPMAAAEPLRVPEPTSIALAGIALMGAAAARRRRR